MAIVYTDKLESLDAAQLGGFFVGWPEHPNPEAHLEILRGSHAVWLALNQNQCVGFINALSDGVFCAFIPLLEVLPNYQRLGIGTELVRRMVETLENNYAIDIVCDESVVPFYTRQGFSQSVGMIRRNYANQGMAHERR